MKKIIKVFICILIALVTITPTSIKAHNEKRIIKVGYIGYDGFINSDDTGKFAGYGVDYLNEISKHSDLEFEYINTDWDESLQMLLNEEIDLVCTAKFTAARDEIYNYSRQSFGRVQGVLYTYLDNDNLYFEDFTNFNNINIGFLKGSLNQNLFKDYATRNNFTYNVIEYDSDAEMTDALLNHDVEAIATEQLVNHSDLKLIANYSSDPFYLMSYKNNDFMDDIDYAMNQINIINPEFENELYNKYYGSIFKDDPHFTREEVEYIEKLLDQRESEGFRGLRVPISVGMNPLAYIENGQLRGIYVDILNEISRITNIPFELVALESSSTPYNYDYFRDNNFDLITAEYNSVNAQYETFRESGMRYTKPFFESKKVVVAKKGFDYSNSDIEYKISYVAGSNTLPIIIKEYFPKSELLEYENIDDCFNSVKNGKSDLLVYNQFLVERELLRPQYDNLAIVHNMDIDDQIVISLVIFKNGKYSEIQEAAVDPLLDDMKLISIINKAIVVIDETYVNQVIIENTIGTYSTSLSFSDFIYKYELPIIIVSFSIILIIVLIFSLYINKQKSYKKVREANSMLEDAVKQAEKANIAKSDFLSRMSHEIRTPMNAIVGLTSICKNYVDNPSKVKEYLDKISGSSKILLNIINDVLDMSAIESNKLKISNGLFDIKELLSQLSTIYYAQCKQKGIKFEMITAEIRHENLIGDALRVNQILLNLISNAYKFTPKGGSIIVEVKENGVHDNKLYLNFRVSDTGCGMNEDLKRRLFKPFEQENASTTKEFGGSGLGLSITKNLVSLMNGAIKFDSEKDKGTTFYVDIPFEFEETSIDSVNLNDVKVLVVDDDKLSLDYSSSVLKRIGVKYDLAKTADEAINLIRQSVDNNDLYKLCLIDYKMPDFNGIEVTKYIRSHFSKEMILIIVSAYDLSEIEESAVDAGANMFISKPIFQSTIFNVIMQMTGGKCIKKSEDDNYDFKGKKVLLAEDNEINAEIAKELLKLVNLDVDRVSNGLEAVTKFNESQIDEYAMILMDIQMPVMDGLQACKEIRKSAHENALSIPIYAMTANAFTEDISLSLSAGMNGHIAKPIDTKILYKTIHDAISNS